MEHAFNTNVAKEYDVDIAILLNNFKFWTIANLANKRHIHDGLCWTFNSIAALCIVFPYWTRHQIEHLLKKAGKLGLLVSGNYNNHKYDRTKWYALTGKAYQLFPELQLEEFIPLLYETISEKTEMRFYHPAISENSEKLFDEFRETFLKFPKPIPDINTDENTDIYTPPSLDHNQKPRDTTYLLKDLLANNPHSVPEHMLEDWLGIRKSKKAKVTRTTWDKINKTLVQIKEELNIGAVTAFETMVANAWQSLEVKYFKDEAKKKTNSSSDPVYF